MHVGSFTIILTPYSIFPTVFTQEIVELAVEKRSYFYKMSLLWRSSVGNPSTVVAQVWISIAYQVVREIQDVGVGDLTGLPVID